jgi:CBS domain-containing protein
VATCTTDDDAKQALALMQSRKIRRVPVVDREKVLRGMLSIYDLARHATSNPGDLSHASFLSAMNKIAERVMPLKQPALALAAS